MSKAIIEKFLVEYDEVQIKIGDINPQILPLKSKKNKNQSIKPMTPENKNDTCYELTNGGIIFYNLGMMKVAQTQTGQIQANSKTHIYIPYSQMQIMAILESSDFHPSLLIGRG